MADEGHKSTTAHVTSSAADITTLSNPTAQSETHQVDRSLNPSSAAGSSTFLSSPQRAAPMPPSLAESQPMTANSSSSSHASVKESANTSSTASPYGTRSRNRIGGARPNYAEDKEMEAEFDESAAMTAANKSASGGDGFSRAQVVDSGRAVGDTTRRAATGTNTLSNAVNNQDSTMTTSAPKDPLPGTSTFSASFSSSTTPAPSKKRKAAQTGQSTNGHSSHTVTASSGHITTRRASMAAGISGKEESNMLTFNSSQAYLSKQGTLKADDGTVLAVNDHVYLICEPPGDPYYLGRIMEFLHANNDHSRPIGSIRVNWYYRPREIPRKVTDTRLVFATMHSDTCPITSLRGKCQILHRSEFGDIDEYRKRTDSFWYDKVYERYMHRHYDVVPTSQVINVPPKVKRVLDERWRFVVAEGSRTKELITPAKSCKRCSGFCASNDSVECAVCRSTFHMKCLDPPLQKKPSRGFGWSCGPCSRAQEKKLDARNTPIVNENKGEGDEEELMDEDEDEALVVGARTANGVSPASATLDIDIHPATPEQVAQARMWPYRYLGVHCRVEDVLDYDDRIYPRASSRLGPRHQANVNVWHGRPVELVKPAEIRKKYVKGGGHKKDGKLSKETLQTLEAEKLAKERRPKWVLDEPPGYVHRGLDKNNDDPDCTARAMIRLPEVGELSSRGTNERTVATALSISDDEREKLIDNYMAQAKELGKSLGVKKGSTNFLDKAVKAFWDNRLDADAALKQLKTIIRRKDLGEPELSKEEVKRFEEGVRMHGSELYNITKHVGTREHADIVRFYYVWKKTDGGMQIWGNYEGRKGKKQAKRVEVNSSKLVDDVADDDDDSAFDNDKAVEKKRGFVCKFCKTTKSRQWRRAPNVTPGAMISGDLILKGGSKDKGAQYMLALCRRCAELWRRYGVQWEDPEEILKKVTQRGGLAWKRRIDEELLKELMVANEGSQSNNSNASHLVVHPVNSTNSVASNSQGTQDQPPKKKPKVGSEKDRGATPTSTSVSITSTGNKKKIIEKPERSPTPEMPKPKVLPCAICDKMEPMGEQHLSCKECRMTVHRQCYGVSEVRNVLKWVCDMCSNDKNPQVSTSYECLLCPVRHTEHDFVEPPKISHKKKTDKEREKDRLERERAVAAAEFYRQRQEDMNRPVNPREPLKRTAGNNWVHVVCAVWTPELKFGNAKALEPLEGLGTIPSFKFEQVCKLCKTSAGACITCHACHAPVHVGCAKQRGYILGFDITPVKSSRRDLVNTVNLGNESGSMTAAVWCKDHSVKTIIHSMDEVVDEAGINAMQLYVQSYKQADLTLTGTVRKANLVNQSTKAVTSVASTTGNRRASTATTTGLSATSQSATRTTFKGEDPEDHELLISAKEADPSKRVCVTCGVDVSPRWRKVAARSSKNRKRSPGQAPLNTDDPMDLWGVAQITGITNGNTHPRNPDATHQMRPNGVPTSREPPETSTALAAAALIVDTAAVGEENSAYICHKCYIKKLEEPPSPPPQVVALLPQPQIQAQQSPPILPVSHAPNHQPQWPSAHQSPMGHYQAWHPPPTATHPPLVNSMSPTHTGNPPPFNGYATNVPPPQNIRSPQLHGSPHQINGVIAHAQPMISGPPPRHVLNDNPPPLPHQHLANGPYPPRYPDQPYPHHQLTPHHPVQHTFGPAHGSSSLIQGRPTTPGESALNGYMGGSRRPGEGRTPSGASASPSLRNLLH